jgi:hypothetical protein
MQPTDFDEVVRLMLKALPDAPAPINRPPNDR